MGEKSQTDDIVVFEEVTYDDSHSPIDIKCKHDDSEGELIELTLDELVPYDLDPRKSVNPMYEEIKVSIRERGLDNPPNVTRRSNTDPWMIADGGNTRLRILKELAKEYRKLVRLATDVEEQKILEERVNSFYRIRCRSKQWRGEINAIAGHVIENELRGDMLFIEKALTVSQLKRRFENDVRHTDTFSQYPFLGLKTPLQPDEELSLRQLAVLLKAVGWNLHPGTLTRFMHAADELVSVIPTALWAGAGHQLVTNIRKLGRVYLDFVRARSDVSESESHPSIATTDYYPLFEALWAESLNVNDAEKIDFLAVRRHMEQRLSECFELPTDYIRLEIDALISGVATGNTCEKRSQNPATPKGISEADTVSNDVNNADCAKRPIAVQNVEPAIINSDSELAQSDDALCGAVMDMASEWQIAHLIQHTSAPEYALGIAMSAPEKAFKRDETVGFVWLKLFMLCQPWSTELDQIIRLAFGNDAVLSHIIPASYRQLELHPDRRSVVQSLRQLEDQAITYHLNTDG